MRSERRVSLREVAAATGMSTTTVSDALNGKGRLPAATRTRVQRIAAELGYTPNIAARNLKAGKTGIVAVMVPEGVEPPAGIVDFDYFMKIISGAMSRTIERGFWLTLAPGPLADRLPSLSIDGALVIDPVRNDPVLRTLRERGIPQVIVGRDIDQPSVSPSVDTDHHFGTRTVLDHLAQRGAKRIALVTGPLVNAYECSITHEYERWCNERQPGVPIVVETVGLTEAAGMAAANDLLNRTERPDAIYALLDRLALGVLNVLTARDIAVPGEMLLATVHDSESVRAAAPPLTVLDVQPRAVGRVAAQLLMDQINGVSSTPTQLTVDSGLICRASTAGYRTSPPH